VKEDDMHVALLCTALLGLLVFGLGLGVSAVRGSTNQNYGYTPDPTDRLYKMVRAHGNACEFAPILALLIMVVGARQPAAWMVWMFVVATVSRYAHAAGMILSPSLASGHPLRFLGAIGTYVAGTALCLAVLLV
jgi:uncharacterized membrane protein YecN with MAPEG domain